jgi:hypothetical protein
VSQSPSPENLSVHIPLKDFLSGREQNNELNLTQDDWPGLILAEKKVV